MNLYDEKFSEIVICTKCKGTGKIKVGNLRECHNHDVVTCFCCQGDGSWIKITSIKYVKKTPELIANLIPSP